MAINAQNNTNYGGTLVNQKYSPLANIVITREQVACRALMQARINTFSRLGAYPPSPPPAPPSPPAPTLIFYSNPVLAPGGVPPAAPMFVASSNRASFMEDLLTNTDTNNGIYGPPTGYDDPNAFGLPMLPVPWYAPLRSGRPLYVVVHWTEYDYYVGKLGAFANVTVVGFRFDAPAGVMDIVGFGASRFAVLQLARSLNCTHAWTVDDNVVNVNAFPAQLATVEALMPMGGAAPRWGISFSGATANETTLSGANINLTPAGALVLGAAGLLQQVTLWNIPALAAANLNTCPLFVTSNEDSSLGNLLIGTGRTQHIITACSVVKYNPYSDDATGTDANRGGAIEVPKRRNRMLQILKGIEDTFQIETPMGVLRNLGDYIRQTVLPNCLSTTTRAEIAQSQAVEQILAAAALQNWLPPAAFDPFTGPPTVVFAAPAALPTP